jgi:ankyrin repeat protein
MDDDALLAMLRSCRNLNVSVAESMFDAAVSMLQAAILNKNSRAARLIIAAGANVDYGADLEELDRPLHLALQGGDENLVRILIAAGANVNLNDNIVGTPLHTAYRCCDERMVSILLGAGANADALDSFNSPPWHMAACNEKETLLEQLIARGIDVNAADRVGNTLCHHAAQNANEKLLAMLMAAGADISQKNKRGCTVCHFAAKNENVAVMALLIDKCDVNAGNKFNDTPCIFAATNASASVLKLLMTAGANLNASNGSGLTAIHFAAANSCEDVLSTLLAANVDANARNVLGITPLFMAARACNLNAVNALIAAGADVKCTSCIPAAAGSNTGDRSGTLKALIACGADVHAKLDGQTALHLAAQRGDRMALEVLIDANANVNALNDNGASPIFYAVDPSRSTDCLPLLLARGARVNLCQNDRRSALMVAIMFNSIAAVELLIAAHADVTLRDGLGWSTAAFALENDTPDILVMLLNAGVSVHAVSKGGATLCHLAAENRCVTHLHTLIRRGANVRGCDDQGRTPAHSASLEALPVLLAAGADLSAVDDAGRLPSHHCKGEALRLLFALGGKLNVADNSGITPCALAEQRDDRDALLTLVAAGAAVGQKARSAATQDIVVAGGGLPAHFFSMFETVPMRIMRVEKVCTQIARRQLELLRLRGREVCVGLQTLRVSAAEMCEILANVFAPLESIVPLHLVWKIVTTVKHFRQR